ncbi:MAG TPA: hypothetical protein VG148_11465 [Pyrinomonadaceae bacterium]|nr:hypothetical protein [Pyrinomonadaceae bacterium]
MSKPFPQIFTPAVLLYLCVFVGQVAVGFYGAGEAEPSPAFSLLYAVGFLWVVGWWLRRDGRRRGVRWVLDMGMFLYLAWPFIMPYHLLKTRGAKGLLLILAFAGVYVGGLALGVVLYTLFVY